jgi:porin
MPHRFSPCLFIIAFAVLILLPTSVQAKRFKPYPGSTETENKDSLDKPNPVRDVPSLNDVNKSEHPKQAEDSGKTAVADDQEKDKKDEDSKEEPDQAPGLFGYALHGKDWLKIEYLYTGEVFTNTRGGISTQNATKYLGLFNLAITGDLDKLHVFPGGSIFLLGEDSHGQGLTQDYVGDEQILSNIDPLRPYTQVSEFWWQRNVLDDFLLVRLGKQDANTEFAVVDVAGDFVNSSFGVHYNIPMPTWPNPAMGAVTMFKLSESIQFKAGVFDGAADGRSWGFSGTGDVFSIYELKKKWKICNERLPGDYHIGMWYHRGDWESIPDPSVTFNNNHGVYMGVEQMIYKESQDKDDVQGLGVFAQYGWSQEDRNRVPNYIGAGLVYKGLVPKRDNDITGVGMAKAIFSPYLEGYGSETAIECFHKIQLSPYIIVQPDLQFIANPGGQYRDSLVAGVCFQAKL